MEEALKQFLEERARLIQLGSAAPVYVRRETGLQFKKPGRADYVKFLDMCLSAVKEPQDDKKIPFFRASMQRYLELIKSSPDSEKPVAAAAAHEQEVITRAKRFLEDTK